ncbi:hypothetical protein D3C81_1804080 [compost metagenome]
MESGLAGKFEQLIGLKHTSLRQRPQQELKAYNLFIKIHNRLHVAGKIMVGNDGDQIVIGEPYP